MALPLRTNDFSVTVSRIVSEVSAGQRLEDVARKHGMSVEAVRAALEYAAQRVSEPATTARQGTGSRMQTSRTVPLLAATEEAPRLELDITTMSPLGRDLLEIRAQAPASSPGVTAR